MFQLHVGLCHAVEHRVGWVLEIESFFVQSGGQDQIWAEQKPKIVTLQWMAKRCSVARDARAGFAAGTLHAYV